jgi:uncharacterized protein YdaU (DUF1376 family)
MSRHIPYFDFYPADFMNGVRGLSAQEVGVYTMILCRIYEESGPIEFHVARLATYCGMRPATFEKVTARLIDLGKFSIVAGCLTNARAEHEISNRANKLKINIKAGKASASKRQQNQSNDATGVERTFNHTEAEADTDNNTLSSVLSAPAENDFEILQSKLLAAAGENGIQPHGAIVVGPISELIVGGVSLEADIIPTIRAVASRIKRPAGSWSYFVPAIKEAYERRVSAGKALPRPTEEFKAGTMMKATDGKTFIPTTEARWSQRVSAWRSGTEWSVVEWGPAPGQAGCNVPSKFLQHERNAA